MWVAAVVVLVLLAAALWLYASAISAAQHERVVERMGERAADAPPMDPGANGKAVDAINNPVLRAIVRRCHAAGLDVAAERVVAYLLAVVVFAGAAIVVLGVLGLLLVAVIAVLIMLVAAQRRRKRRRRINAQLPNFLGYLVRALTAGNTLEEGVHSAAMESDEPIRSVFLSISRQVQLGASIEDTLADAAGVHDLRALHILAMSARVNRRYGGSMRRVVASLIETIRQQEAAARELKALTGETRFSAYVVAAIPVAISLFFYLQNPAYYATMLQSSGGRIAIMCALGLEALGLFIIWRMMSRLQEPDA